jgi:DNA polymerase III epsilon subunit-like protein
VPATAAVDTRALARAAFPGRPSYALDALCRELGLARSEHRALADARSCRLVFLACLERLAAAGAATGPADLAAIGGPPIDLCRRAGAVSNTSCSSRCLSWPC